MATSDHRTSRPFEGSGAAAKGLTGVKKCVGQVPLNFQLRLNTIGLQSFPTDINLKDGGQENVGAVQRKPSLIFMDPCVVV
jgi:hypothetical protein